MTTRHGWRAILRGMAAAACLTAVGGCNESQAPEPSGVIPVQLLPPSNITAIAGNARVILAWSTSSAAEGYYVKRASNSGGPYSRIGASAMGGFTDASVNNGTAYYYVLSSVNTSGESGNSPEVSASPQGATPPIVTPPAAPANLAATPGNGQVGLTWSASNGATGYRVKRSTNATGPFVPVAIPASTLYVDTSLTNGATYYYRVAATNSSGEGADSVQTSATPVAPPSQVSNCSNLGAARVFQDITPPGAPSTVAVAVDPSSGAVYAGTGLAGIFKSLDCGASWTKVNTGRNREALDSGYQFTFLINPSNPQVMYAGSLYGSKLGLLRSTNGGVDWDELFPTGSNVATTVEYGGFFQSASMDAQDPAHIIVSFHANCTGQVAPSCMAETTNGGNTWRLFKGPTDSWSEAASPFILARNKWLLMTLFNGIYYTPDAGATWQKVSNESGLRVHKAVDGTFYMTGLYSMMKSTDGQNWTKIPGSPGSQAIASDGKNIYVGTPGPADIGGPNYYMMAESGDGSWTTIPSPQPKKGTEMFALDTGHHVLYVATGVNGRLYRMATE